MSSLKILVWVGAVGALMAGTAVLADGAATRSVASGESWTVERLTPLRELVIASGAHLQAAEGKSLTMTIGGVETPIGPGTYRGAIVLSPTDAIDMTYRGMGSNIPYRLRAAVYVHDGKYQPLQSVVAAATGGEVTDQVAQGIRITSQGPLFNGVYVDGNSSYRIERATIGLDGHGANDFAGVAAAVAAAGTSNVTVDNARISNRGAVRVGVWVGDRATVTVNNAFIDMRDGPLPADYGWSWTGPPKAGSVIMEVPWFLGLTGTARATVLTGQGTAYYNDSHIRSEGWGALGVDGAEGAHLFATNSRIETVKRGYGAYADGDVLDTFRHCTFDVVDYGLIMGGGSAIFTDGTVVKSRRIGVMAHDMGPNFNNPNLGTLTIDKGSVFTTGEAVIQLKSASPTIVVDGAKLSSRSGLILQAMINDDPNEQQAVAARAAGKWAGPPPRSEWKSTTADGDNDIDATFRHVSLKGDFVNAMTALSGLNLRFEGSTVTGAISTATGKHAIGRHGEVLAAQDKPDLNYLIGRETEVYGFVDHPHGVSVSLDAHSTWIVDKASYLTRLVLQEGAKVQATRGRCLVLEVDGQRVPIHAGTYAGKIALKQEKCS
jgi:hypothetical protein